LGALGLAIEVGELGLEAEIDLLGDPADVIGLVVEGAEAAEVTETLAPCSVAVAGVSAPLCATSAPTPIIDNAAVSINAGSARVDLLTCGAESASASSIHSGLLGGVILAPFVNQKIGHDP
jgi:hypothetical protein